MKPGREIYLIAEGKLCGPFSAPQVAQLRQSGNLRKYALIWDNTLRDWVALHPEGTGAVDFRDYPPPPKPPADASPKTQSKTQSKPLPSLLPQPWDQLHVSAHNFRAVLPGRLEEVTERGGCLVVDGRGDALFANGSPVVLHLTYPPTQRSVTLTAKLGEAQVRGTEMVYRFRWPGPPTGIF